MVTNPGKKISRIGLLGWIGFIILFFVGFFLINSKTGFMSDDYLYHFIYGDYPDWGTLARITGFRDILKSMAAEYKIETGRIPVHIMVQLLLMFDKAVFNVCNSIVAVLLGILIYFHANYERKRSLLLFVLIYFLLWFFIPAANFAMVWLSGSVNYMWACTFILMFLLPYRIYAERKRSLKHSMFLSVVMVPTGLLAGWSHESIGGVAGLMALLYIIYYFRNKIKIPAWAISGIISVAVGLFIMLSAPGSYLRANRIRNDDHSYSFFNTVINVMKESLSSLFPLFLLLSIAFIVLFYIRNKAYNNSAKKQKALLKNEYISSLIPAVFYFISAIASFVVLIFAPYFTLRELFVSSILLIISICIAVSKIINEISMNEKGPRLNTILIISVCSISIAVDAAIEYHSCSHNYSVQTGIEDSIKLQVENGQKDIVFKGEYFFMSKGHFNIYNSGDPGTVFSIGDDPDYPTNKLFAQYYGAETLANDAKLTLID